MIAAELKLASDRSRSELVALRNLMRGLSAGARLGTVTVGTASGDWTAAAGTVALVQASLTAGDIVYVGSVGFVATNGAVTLGAATFDMRTSNDACGISLAAQINAHASLTGVVTAANVSGTVTVTAVAKGAIGNHVTLAKANTNNAAIILNGLANTVLQSTLLAGAGGLDSAPVTYAVR